MVEIVMIIDDEEYVYGKYPFNTPAERTRVNELAMQIRDVRDCLVFIRHIDE